MCGIVYVKRKDGRSAVKSVKKRYKKQKYRGQEGFGYVAIKNDTIVSYQRAITEHEILQKLDKEDAPEILFHHRYPTSTPNMEEQAHPLYVKQNMFMHEYYVAHNGVIKNPLLRKMEHEKLGMKYATELKPLWQTTTKKLYHAAGELKFNDSEAVAVDTAMILEGLTNTIEAEGASAVVALKVKDGKVIDRIFYRNNGNPLKLLDTKHMLTVTSLGEGIEIAPIYLMHLNGDVVEKMPETHFVPRGFYYPARGTTSQIPWKTDTTGRYAEDDTGYSRGSDYDREELDIERYFSGTASLLPTVVTPKQYPDLSIDSIVSDLEDNTLWAEYDKNLGAIKSLEAGIKLLEDKVDAGIENDGITKGLTNLRASLIRSKVYKVKLDREISLRITASKTG